MHPSPTLSAGVLLVVVGAIFLAQNLGLAPGMADLALGVLVAAAGIGVLALSIRRRRRWWLTIGGSGLVALGTTVAITGLYPELMSAWSDAIVFGSLGIAFLVGYLVAPRRWWAIIPGGALLTLALVSGPMQMLPHDVSLGVFLVGMGITFVVVALVPRPEGDRSWAWAPAALFAILGFLALAATSAGRVLWPGLVIALGLFLLIRSARGPGAEGGH